MFDRRHFLGASGALLLGSALPAVRTARAAPGGGTLLFGYPPGSVGTQLAVGALALLHSTAGLNYALKNVDGHNTRDAAVQAARGAADGSVLLQAQSTSMCLLQAVYRNLGYDPLRDFAPLGCFGEYALSLTVGPAVPRSVTTLEQFEGWVKNNPDQRDIGFAIYGSQGHLATLMLAKRLGVPFATRPYKGSAQMLDDLQSGNLPAGFTAAGNGSPNAWAGGTLRSLGTTQAHRVPYWPGVPTLQEQGVSGMDINVWYGWFAPVAVPAATVASLREKVVQLQASPGYVELLKPLLISPLSLTPAQISRRIAEEGQQYAQLADTLGLRPLD